MTLPALNNLREKYPDAQIDYMCGLENEVPILKRTGLVDQIFVYNVKKNSWLDLVKLALQLRSRKYDIGISLGGSPRGLDILFMKLSGCRKITAANVPAAIYKKYHHVSIPESMHRVERAVKIIGSITENEMLQPVTLTEDVHMEEQIRSRYDIHTNDRMIGLVIGTGNFMYRDGKKIIQYNTKQWELKKFMELSKRLVNAGYRVILIGGEKEKEDFSKEHMETDQKIICALGELQILESVAAMTLCELVVGADTGPMHCAAAVGVPTLTLFGPTDARLIAPYGEHAYILESDYSCRRCYSEDNEKGRSCHPAQCMQAITVDAVYEKILEIRKELLTSTC